MRATTSSDARTKKEKLKRERYMPNYHLLEAQVVPLVFTTTGAWSEKTVEFLQPAVKKIARGDEMLFNRLWRTLRYRIAIAIAKGEGTILNWLRWKNQDTW